MFAILLYCKRFTAINYSLNLTFFYKFSAILLGCSVFFGTGDLFGLDPDPNPTRSLPRLARARPEHRTIVTSFDYCRYSGCEFGVQEILVRRPPLSSPRTIARKSPDPKARQCLGKLGSSA